MNWIKRNLSLIILLAFVVATIVTGYIYYLSDDKSQKLGNFLGGCFTGLLIATIEYLITLDERSKLDKIKALKIKEVLFNRAEESYYRNLIRGAKINIHIMGVTAVRFLQDFAQADSNSSDKKVLFDALNRNVEVRILLPEKIILKNENDLSNFDISLAIMKKIHDLYPSKFNYRYFNHEPAHSIFNIDDETIIGPVIPNLSSKDTPGIHVLNSSKYAKTFLEYFQKEWDGAK